jgi:hypothetical protein
MKKLKNVPVTNRGQWDYPGMDTIVPSGQITMKGVPYPVMGMDNTGHSMMMMPGGEYSFPGDMVYETPMMKQGGYVVTKSNDRKGKTHKVTGPDGTVKYFGDSELGQHPKDPERKAAFYARHKKNLENNPYFRAFARKTWEEGGEIDEFDVMMMQNGGEMIRRADGSYSQRGLWDNIRANKGSGKQPTKEMLDQERKIKAKMQEGGWLQQYQNAGEVSTEQNPERMNPIEIQTKKDPWYERYPRMAWRPIDKKLHDFGSQYAQRISDATGGADWYKQSNPFMNLALELLNAPQYTGVYAATGKVQTPSEALNIENPVGAFLIDSVLDPSNIFGAGLTKIPVKAAAGLNKVAKKAVREALKNPKVAFAALQRRLPSSMDDVVISPGMQSKNMLDENIPRDKRINDTVKFLSGLKEEGQALQNSIERRIADLESPTGFERLVKQEKQTLINSGEDPLVAERLGRLQAKARIQELKTIDNVNLQIKDYDSKSFLIPEPIFNDYLYSNAYYDRPIVDKLSNVINKTPGSINLSKKMPINYANPEPGTVGIGYNLAGSTPIHMHEIGHGIQRGRVLPIDSELRYTITPKSNLNSIEADSYEYFREGSGGLEPSAFANELRESLLQKGFIKDTYDEITPDILKKAHKHFKANPMGTYFPEDFGSFLSSTRILDFMKPSKSNFSQLSNVLNKLPAVAPIGVGLGLGASQLPEQKSGRTPGWLNKYN